MKTWLVGIATCALLLGAQGSARADLVYDNGPINGTINAWNVTSFEVTDSFTVSSATSLTSATVGLWGDPGATPLSLSWSIGTSPFASDVSSGVSTLTSTLFTTGAFGFYDINSSDFAISGAVGVGTYWLSLTATVTSDGGQAYWDENDGPSSAFQTSTGALPGSQSFQIYGGNSVPEPSTITLSAIGAAFAFGMLRRKKQSAV